jgi:hypothetical protein
MGGGGVAIKSEEKAKAGRWTRKSAVPCFNLRLVSGVGKEVKKTYGDHSDSVVLECEIHGLSMCGA